MATNKNTSNDVLENYISLVEGKKPLSASNGEASNADDNYSTQSAVSTTSNKTELWNYVSSSAVNLILPFINGMMLGFGEILAHEIGFHFNWFGAKVQPAKRLAERKQRFYLL